VLTDDSGLQLMGSVVMADGEERIKLSEDDLRVCEALSNANSDCH